MKTRLSIIIGIVITFLIIAYLSSISTPEETMIVGYCQGWCNADELSHLGCNAEVIDFIYRATNLFDENYDDHYFYLNLIGLPDSISQEKFDECLDVIREKRTESLENTDLNSKGCPQFCSEKVDDNVFSFCGGDGFYTEKYMFTNNSTHHFNHDECEWQIIEPNLISGLGLLQDQQLEPIIKDVDPEFLEQQYQAILEYCENTDELVSNIGLSHHNTTHYIDTITCQWHEMWDGYPHRIFRGK